MGTLHMYGGCRGCAARYPSSGSDAQLSAVNDVDARTWPANYQAWNRDSRRHCARIHYIVSVQKGSLPL